MNQNLFSRFVWVSHTPPSELIKPALLKCCSSWSKRQHREDKTQPLSARLQAAQPAPLTASAAALMMEKGADTGRFGYCLEAKPFYPGIYTYGPDFRRIWGLVLVSFWKGVRFRKLQVTFVLPLNRVSLFCRSSKTGKLRERQLWCRIPPKTAAKFGLS